jgi:hypothetical protein
MRQFRVSQFRLPAAAVVMVVLGLAGAEARADINKNEVLKHWQKFKPGSSVTLAATINAGGMSIQTEMKNTLVKIESDKITLETTTTTILNGQRHEIPPTTQVIDANSDQGTWEVVGQEKITAGGHTYDCKIVDGKSLAPSRGGPPTDAKARIWINDDVPGGAVQIKANGSGHEITFTLVSFEAK